MPEHLFPSRKPSAFPWVMVLSGLLMVMLMVLVVWQGLSIPPSSIQKDVLTLNQASGTVLEDQGFTLVSPGGEARVYVPCCSLGAGGTVSLVMREPNLFQDPAGMEVWSRPWIANLEFNDPAGKRIPGTVSNTPLEICFRLDNNAWSHFLLTPTDFQIQMYDERAFPKFWKAVNTYSDQSTQSLCSQITQLSLYSLAVKGIPIPNTGPKGIYAP